MEDKEKVLKTLLGNRKVEEVSKATLSQLIYEKTIVFNNLALEFYIHCPNHKFFQIEKTDEFQIAQRKTLESLRFVAMKKMKWYNRIRLRLSIVLQPK